MGVVAIYELPVPIWISTDVLGKRLQSGFGPLVFDVLMPRQAGAVGAPPVLEGVEAPTRRADSDELLIWTQRFAAFTPGADGESTALFRIVVQTHDRGEPGNQLDILARMIDPWFDAVRTWVEAVTQQDLDPNHRVYDATVVGGNLTVLEPALTGDSPIGLILTTPRITPVAGGAWRGILARVAAGDEPPLEEQLSRDARAAFASLAAGGRESTVSIELGAGPGLVDAGVPTGYQFNFEPRDAPALEKAGRYLASLAPAERVTAYGWLSVVARPQRGRPGVVRMKVLAGSSARTLQVRLSDADFEIAAEAIARELVFRVSGRQEKDGNRYWLYDAHDVRSVDVARASSPPPDALPM
ncbi:hypothetical protein [Cellulomonas wangsupingiae]|uniref:Uncharacterized protein n=1 Tax=Cellulomonas wangsupingiae TaxID=2968085 RepID=A0ABY5K6F9_9CELL|nr:hypothetical protein [Cellulomonas wangsupingiae]MCC2334253.1 hypothetical protein [Cellulomonas wangsupingiae]MCM0641253.1 hypothetical protein [Cellulomonas wangsupingiae]UUI65930.1 hypothetical protein NP075_04125 [Cellulomonas wangsupingiae]